MFAVPKQPAQQEPAGSVYRYGKDSSGTPWHGIRWTASGLDLPDGTLIYTSPPAQQEPVLQNIEQYRLQMAGISTAAIGYWKEGDGIHPDYDTVALRDVAKLYAKYDELYRAQRTWVGLTDEEIARVVSLAGFAPDWVEAHIAIQIVRVLEAELKEKNGL